MLSFAQSATSSAAKPVVLIKDEQAPAHPVTSAQVKQLMTLAHMEENVRLVMHRSIQDQRRIMTILPDGFWDDFEKEVDKIDWVAIATPYYQKHLSQEDAKAIIEFYSSEAGQRALSMTTVMMTELGDAGRRIGGEIGARLGEKYKDEIEARMKKQQGNDEIRLNK